MNDSAQLIVKVKDDILQKLQARPPELTPEEREKLPQKEREKPPSSARRPAGPDAKLIEQTEAGILHFLGVRAKQRAEYNRNPSDPKFEETPDLDMASDKLIRRLLLGKVKTYLLTPLMPDQEHKELIDNPYTLAGLSEDELKDTLQAIREKRDIAPRIATAISLIKEARQRLSDAGYIGTARHNTLEVDSWDSNIPETHTKLPHSSITDRGMMMTPLWPQKQHINWLDYIAPQDKSAQYSSPTNTRAS